MDSRRFVIGDIHGANRALEQCFDRSSFNPGTDWLICLGDICDRWPEVNKVFDNLLRVKHLVFLLGNHDQWALEWFEKGTAPEIWLRQGGINTVQAYPEGVPDSHVALLQGALFYFELDNQLFVHGGYHPDQALSRQGREIFLWDRTLIREALFRKQTGNEQPLTPYKAVYVGHTPTLNFGSSQPIHACEVYLMDTGAGWPGGVLTMMDLDSGMVYQSESVDQLYG